MVQEWRVALYHAFSLLSDDGELHIVDFGQCEGLPRAFAPCCFAGLTCFMYRRAPE